MSKKFNLLWLILLLINIVLSFWLIRSKTDESREPIGPFYQIATDLQFNEVQKKELEPFRQRHRERLMGIDREIGLTKQAFFRQISQTNKRVADSLLFELGELVKDREAEVFHYLQQVKSLCTPEQEEKMHRLIEQDPSLSSARKP